MNSNPEISQDKYKAIENLIGSDESVVGIDAKKTHIIIIHMLQQLQEKITSVEERLAVIEEKVKPVDL